MFVSRTADINIPINYVWLTYAQLCGVYCFNIAQHGRLEKLLVRVCHAYRPPDGVEDDALPNRWSHWMVAC